MGEVLKLPNITEKIESHRGRQATALQYKDPDIRGHVLTASSTFDHIKKAEAQRGAISTVRPVLQPEEYGLVCAMVQQGLSSLRVH